MLLKISASSRDLTGWETQGLSPFSLNLKHEAGYFVWVVLASWLKVVSFPKFLLSSLQCEGVRL